NKKSNMDYDKAAAQEFEKSISDDWNSHWNKFWRDNYSDKHIDNIIKSLEIKIAKLTNENNSLFEENIYLGEIIEGLKYKLSQLQEEMQRLTKENKNLNQGKGFFKTNFKLAQAKRRIEKLEEDNKELQERYRWVGRKPLDTGTVEKILALSQIGHSQREIASMLSVSKSVVAKYLSKPEYAKLIR
ncbi:MAG: hypothetical protein LBV08_08520, partial [Clostridiales bacterium]|nr:hypothetical protein [Clostridiales bacterium]